ncbi:hypothetical protein D9M71_534790 [compost metagenome]
MAPAAAPPAAQAELSMAPRPPPTRPPIRLQMGQFPWLTTAPPSLEVEAQPERKLLTRRKEIATRGRWVLMMGFSCVSGEAGKQE